MGQGKLVLTKGTATLKGALKLLLDESMTALQEAIAGLQDSDCWREITPGKHMIGTMFLHSLATLDVFGCGFLAGKEHYGVETWYDMWENSPEDVKKLCKEFPSVEQLLERSQKIRETTGIALEAFDDSRLAKVVENQGWWTETGRNYVDGFIRVIGHVNSHVRQIWALRGLIGKVDPENWPEQHLA
jgi:hypothetical protein